MKILKIKATNLPLFAEPLEIDFFANQRVSPSKNEMLTNVFSNSSTKIFTNNSLAFVGINASGKTTTLKVISFVMQMLNSTPINSIQCNDILKLLSVDCEVLFEVFFYDCNDNMNLLQTHISKSEQFIDNSFKYIISKETLYSMSSKSFKNKSAVFDVSNYNKEKTTRDLKNVFLSDDVSIIIGVNKANQSSLEVFDAIRWTNFNGIRFISKIPLSLVKFLDPSIEYLKCNYKKDSPKNVEFRLKFEGKKEIFLNEPMQLGDYLSSGTIKGINIFITAMIVLNRGGYLIIDELENHFNIEIVLSLIKFFNDSTTNKNGATIIFSTHYTELLDNLERNDCLFICENVDGIKIQNLSCILENNNINKSEWFQSGCYVNTAPSYDNYIKFKNEIANCSLEVM